MSKSKYDVMEIVKEGIDVVVSASKLSKYDLIEIVKSVKSGSHITIVDTEGKSKYDLIEIAKSATKGSLTLHL